MRKHWTCQVAECGQVHYCRGYCKRHHWRFMKYGDPLGGGTFHGEPLRYLDEVVMAHRDDDCLIWPYSRTAKGYAVIKVGKRQEGVPRVICERLYGPAPTPAHQSAHLCGRGHLGCVTPGHLVWKTPRGNQHDRYVHGTHNRGSRHPQTCLTEEDVRVIRSLGGIIPHRDLADMYGLLPSSIGGIIAGRSWSHVQ